MGTKENNERAYVLAKKYISDKDIIDIEAYRGGMYIVTAVKKMLVISIGNKTERVYSLEDDGELKEITYVEGS